MTKFDNDDLSKKLRALNAFFESPTMKMMQEQRQRLIDTSSVGIAARIGGDSQAIVDKVTIKNPMTGALEHLKNLTLDTGKLGHLLKPFEDHKLALKGLLTTDALLKLETHFARVAFPSIGTLTALEGFSLLTPDNASDAASLIGLEPQKSADAEIPPPVVGAFTRPLKSSPPALEVDVNVTIDCFVCGTPMCAIRKGAQWTGDRHFLVSKSVIPICLTCLEGDPATYILRLKEKLRKPPRRRFEVIEGGGVSTGLSSDRGYLRLVRDDDTEEAEEQED